MLCLILLYVAHLKKQSWKDNIIKKYPQKVRCSLNDSELCRLTRNSSHFRNELHAGQPLRSGSVAEWTLPEVLLTYPVVVFEDRRWSIGIHVVHVSKCHQISIVACSYCFAFLHHRVLLAVQTTHGPVAHLERHRASRSCQADEFELDYVSSKRPSTTAKSLTDPLWERLMVWETQIGFGEDGNGHIKRTQMVPCFDVTRSCRSWGQSPQISVRWRGHFQL